MGVPQHVLLMLFFVEDKRFGQHRGIDVMAVTRAMVSNLLGSGSLQGASTLTQQLYDVQRLVDDESYPRKRKLSRKLNQLVFAVKKELIGSKEEILYEYLTNVYWGADFVGIDAAATGYFGSTKESLTVAQSFFLAERLASPNVDRPSRVASLLSRRVIAELMDEQDLCTEELHEIYFRWSSEVSA